MKSLLHIRLYGTFLVRLADGKVVQLGAKHQALLGLLSSASDGVRTRSFLENHLWSLAQPEQAKASLRTALSTLRRNLGPEAGALLSANRERVILDMDRVEVEEGAGPFMEGFALPHEEQFSLWIAQMRGPEDAGAVHHAATIGAVGDQGRIGVEALLPSIAVLPFANRASAGGGNPLGSILAEEMSRLLSRSQGFSVTSYLTTRQFNPTTALTGDIAQTCGVQYLLTGSVIVSGQAFRLTADLQDATRERVLWSRDYSGNVTELLAGDPSSLLELTGHIGRTAVGEALRMTTFRPLEQLESHTLLMAGISLLQDMRAHRFNSAHELFTLLVQREPNHPLTLTWLGFWHVMRVQKGLSPDRDQDARMGGELADKALQIDPGFSLALTLKGMVQSHLNGRFDLAAHSYDLAIQDNPNEALALLLKGAMRAFQDAPQDAVKLTDAARRLSPLDPQGYYFDALSATAQLAAHNFDQAVFLADRSLQVNQAYPSTLRTKAIALEMSGQGDKARKVVHDLMKITPQFTVGQYLREHPAVSFQVGRDWAKALQAAGVPE
ncbi:transcriptional regulator [Aliisedimentitalea scapharcae]|uniref:Transcriptional regulator n=1 Tax=Aliisedimentitalea scapharcae TaxID=1524259 RepID=A0ABZ2XQY0_9RHOB